MDRVRQVVRTSGLLDTLQPVEQMRQNQAVRQVIDLGGGVFPSAASPFRTPLTHTWSPSDTGRKRAAQSGTIVTFAAHAAIAPSTGNCIVTLTMVTEAEGLRTIGTCQITNGASIGETPLNELIPSGAWLGATVTTANGASGVSISVTQKV